MKKRNKIVFVILLCLSIMDLNAKAIPLKFGKNLSNASSKQINKIAKELPKTTKSLDKIKKLDDIPSSIKADPSKSLIYAKADEIVNKGKFEKEFFDSKTFDSQLSIIVQSNKFGDEYFFIAKKLDLKDIEILKTNNILPINKLSNLSNNDLQNKFIETLKYTGDAGWKTLKSIAKVAKENPKSALATSAFLWYVIDPESFENTVESSGKNVGEFLIATPSSFGAGIAIGIKNKIIESFKSGKYLTDLIFGIVVIGIFIFIYRRRKIILNYIFVAKEPEEKENNTRDNQNNVQKVKQDNREFRKNEF